MCWVNVIGVLCLLGTHYGPVEVLNRVGKAAYRLRLPLDSKIHQKSLIPLVQDKFWFEESKEVSVHKVDVSQMHSFIDVPLEHPKRWNLQFGQLFVMRWKTFLQQVLDQFGEATVPSSKLRLFPIHGHGFLATVVHKWVVSLAQLGIEFVASQFCLAVDVEFGHGTKPFRTRFLHIVSEKLHSK